jgi:hypothetical protein
VVIRDYGLPITMEAIMEGAEGTGITIIRTMIPRHPSKQFVVQKMENPILNWAVLVTRVAQVYEIIITTLLKIAVMAEIICGVRQNNVTKKNV